MTTLAQVILRDTAANRPAAGTAGRLFYDTTNEKWQRDTGATWEDCEPAAGAGGAVATDAIWDAAGDLAIGTGANTAAKLAIGTANQLLRVNAGATAPEWASVGRVLLSEQTPSGTGTVTFSSIPSTYKNLIVEFICRSTKAGAANDSLSCRLNTDTTDANYRRQLLDAYGGTAAAAGGDDAIIAYISAANAPADTATTGFMRLIQYAGTTFQKLCRTKSEYRYDTSSTHLILSESAIHWENTAAITQIDLVLGSGNYVAGSTFRLYGEF